MKTPRRRDHDRAFVVFGVLATLGSLLLTVTLAFGAIALAGSAMSALDRTGVYEVGARPPAGGKGVAYPPLPKADSRVAASIRKSLEKRDFRSLDREFQRLEADATEDPEAEFVLDDAYRILADSGTEPLMDDWVRAMPDSPRAYNARAYFHLEAGWDARGDAWAKDTSKLRFERMQLAFDKALDDTEQVLRLEPRSVIAYVVRVGVHGATSSDAFDQTVREARRHFPSSYLLHGSIQRMLTPRWGGSYPAMERLAREAIANNPSDPRFWRLYGMIYEDQASMAEIDGDVDDALSLYDRALAYSRSWDYYLGRSRCELRLVHHGRALADATRAVAADPSRAGAYLGRAQVLLASKDASNAIKDLDTAIRLEPRSAEHRYWRARAWNLRGDRDRARDDALASIERDPHRFEAYVMLDRILVEQGRGEEMVELWSALIELEPDNDRARFERAGLYQRLGEQERAREDLARAAELGSLPAKAALLELKTARD